jgi:predicted ATPase
VLASLASADLEQVELHLAGAVRARILQDAGASVFRFAHDTVRECLYTEVTAVRRRRLHAAIGEALERRGTTGDRHLADLAFHFTRAGDRARGATYALAAADRALASFAGAEAQSLYGDALAMTDAGDHSVRGSVGIRLILQRHFRSSEMSGMLGGEAAWPRSRWRRAASRAKLKLRRFGDGASV